MLPPIETLTAVTLSGSATLPAFSWRVLGTLLAVALLPAGAFAWLAYRWTLRPFETALRDWVRRNRFRRGSRLGTLSPPPPIDRAEGLRRVERHWAYRDGGLTFLRLRGVGPGTDAGRVWHLLVRDMPVPAAEAGLRPVGADATILDAFGLPTFARLSAGKRFEVIGHDARAAADLADGPARAMLPPDVGLLRLRHHLVLDFSARPFDPVEMTRMLSVARQVAGVV